MPLRVRFPGYLDLSNGMRNDVPWEQLHERMLPFWQAGIPIHCHANGDESIDAAHILGMERTAGSLEPGKFADFAILEEDPYEVNPTELRDIPIWGTARSGVLHQA